MTRSKIPSVNSKAVIPEQSGIQSIRYWLDDFVMYLKRNMGVYACVILGACLFFNASPVHADSITVALQIPIMGEVKIPICQSQSETGPDGKPREVLVCTGIAKYISIVYQWTVAFAAILAVLAFTYAGVLWLIAGGDSGKVTESKKVMGNALIGLLLALGSYMLLNLINPNLVAFKAIRVPGIGTINLDLIESEIDEPMTFSGTGTTYTGLPHLSVSSNAKKDLETPGIIDPKMIIFLNKLDKIAEDTGILYHISLNRGHSIHVKGSDKTSQHKNGAAVDITYKLENEDPKLIELAQKLIEIHKSNPGELEIKQLIFSSPSITELIYAKKISNPSVYRDSLPGHKNHIHVGVDAPGSFHSFPGDPN